MISTLTRIFFLSLLPLSFGRSSPLLFHSEHVHTPSYSREVIMESVEATHTMALTLALHPNNKTGLIDTLMDISDPSSANYRQHLSKSEVRRFRDAEGALLSTDPIF